MKGIVFTEFLEMVESRFGLETVDSIVDRAELPSGGAYTSVGTYPAGEMVALLKELSISTGFETHDLLYAYGLYLFDTLVQAHPDIVKRYTSAIDLLSGIEDHIHVHVRKLYPDAELPSFKVLERSETTLKMVYSSSRGLYPLAHGLMVKTFEHFDSRADIQLSLLKEDGTEVLFTIRKHDAHGS